MSDSQSKTWGVIGTGHMASAVIRSVLDKKLYPTGDISVFDVAPERMKPYADLGLHACADARELVRSADLILIAVRPGQLDGLLRGIGGLCAGKCIVSIAAGVATTFIKERTAPGTYVVRVMPNTTLALGRGAAAIAEAPGVPETFFERACALFSCGGVVEIIREEQMNAVIGVNGSSPAYFYKMIAAMAEYAEKQGLDRSAALRLAAKTMEGAAVMLQDGENDPVALIRQVATPGGTTEAALQAMDRCRFDEAVGAGMLACTKRASELSGN